MIVKKKLNIQNSPDDPREKLLQYGAENLTDSELVALVIRSGGSDNSVLEISRKLMLEHKTLKNLFSLEYEQLVNTKYIGQAKAACLKATGEISKRITHPDTSSKVFIKTAQDAFEFMRKDLFNQTKEFLYLLAIDSRNNLISKSLISVGTINETLIHPREIFKIAIIRNAVSIVLVHNHPSGDPTPSTNDINTTERIIKAGIIMGIGLLDHVVVTDNDYRSVKNLMGIYGKGVRSSESK